MPNPCAHARIVVNDDNGVLLHGTATLAIGNGSKRLKYVAICSAVVLLLGDTKAASIWCALALEQWILVLRIRESRALAHL